MKTLDEIKSCRRIAIAQTSFDGGSGIIHMPTWTGSVIWSTGAGWDHVSVSPEKLRITPSWDDMCLLKDIFFYDSDAVIQIHPPKDMYVNNVPNCLHLWRCNYLEMIMPPSCLVGIKKGQTRAELEQEIREAYALAGEEY